MADQKQKEKTLFEQFLALKEEKDKTAFVGAVNEMNNAIVGLKSMFIDLADNPFTLVDAETEREEEDYSDEVRMMVEAVTALPKDEIIALSDTLDEYVGLTKRCETLKVHIGDVYEFNGKKMGVIEDVPKPYTLILRKLDKEGKPTKKRIQFSVPKIVEMDEEEDE